MQPRHYMATDRRATHNQRRFRLPLRNQCLVHMRYLTRRPPCSLRHMASLFVVSHQFVLNRHLTDSRNLMLHSPMRSLMRSPTRNPMHSHTRSPMDNQVTVRRRAVAYCQVSVQALLLGAVSWLGSQEACS